MIVSLLIAILIVIVIYVASHRLSGLQVFVVLSAAFAGVTLVIFPTLAARAAAALGVGRGTDLLLYLSIVGGFFIIANFYFRFKRQEQQLIEIVRAQAIDQARFRASDDAEPLTKPYVVAKPQVRS